MRRSRGTILALNRREISCRPRSSCSRLTPYSITNASGLWRSRPSPPLLLLHPAPGLHRPHALSAPYTAQGMTILLSTSHPSSQCGSISPSADRGRHQSSAGDWAAIYRRLSEGATEPTGHWRAGGSQGEGGGLAPVTTFGRLPWGAPGSPGGGWRRL